MTSLPPHGRVECTRCLKNLGPKVFNEDFQQEYSASDGKFWGIYWNPLSWGSIHPEVVVLGFSKGPNQRKAISEKPHDDVAYAGGRKEIGKIFRKVGMPELQVDDSLLEPAVSKLIADTRGRFHFGSVVRCSAFFRETAHADAKSSGNKMLEGFTASDYGRKVTSNCIKEHLTGLFRLASLVFLIYAAPTPAAQPVSLILNDPRTTSAPTDNCDHEICRSLLELINSARKRIDFAIYGIRNQSAVLNALVEAQARGVLVRGVVDADVNGENYYSDTPLLLSQIRKRPCDTTSPPQHSPAARLGRCST